MGQGNSDSQRPQDALPPEESARPASGDEPTTSGTELFIFRDPEPNPQASSEESIEVDERKETIISQRPVAAPEEFYKAMPLADMAAMLEGKRLDHFCVEQMIGGGGMGAVFRGRDERLDRTVAIKVIPAAKRDPETLRRFRLEAQAAARLDHPNIARVYYIGESEQWNYIVFEFIDGVNIRDLVAMEGPLNVDDAIYYTRQIAEALYHAHERGVVHRDIKPSNILVTASGVAKVVDMGLARNTALEKSTADITASGITLGTFDYISPEQARDPRDADVRSDLYSLGCSLFFMLTGHPPFPEGTALQKLLNHGSQPPPDPRGWRDDLSDQLYEIVMKLMAKQPGNRYQKPAELINDLMLLAKTEELVRSQLPGTLILTPAVAQRSLLEANLPWMVALAFLLGSALWLQSVQAISDGYAFPELPSALALPEASERNNTFSEVPASNNPVANESTLGNPATSNPAQADPGSGRPGQSDARSSVTTENSRPAGYSGRSAVGPGISEPDVSRDSGSGGVAGNRDSEADSGYWQPPSASGAESRPATSETDGKRTDPALTFPDAVLSRSERGESALGRRTDSGDVEPDVGTSKSAGNNQNPSDQTMGDRFRNGSPPLVVSQFRPADVELDRWESSIGRAVERLEADEQKLEIELRGRVVLSEPLFLRDRDLVIRGRADASPQIEIESDLLRKLEDWTAAIQLTGGSLGIYGVKMVTSAASLSRQRRIGVFNLLGTSHLILKGTSLTIAGPAESARSLFVILIDEKPSVGYGVMFQEAEETEDSSSTITAVDTVIRGQASGVGLRMDQALYHRIGIGLTNSLVAIEGFGMELSRTINSQDAVSRQVRLVCRNSTFVTQDGFALLDFTGPAAPLFSLNRTSDNCVYASSRSEAHLIVRGPVSPAVLGDMPWLVLKGSDNAYDQGVSSLAACQDRNGITTTTFGFNEATQESWFDERAIERRIPWVTTPTLAMDLSQTTLADFAIQKDNFFSIGVESSADFPDLE